MVVVIVVGVIVIVVVVVVVVVVVLVVIGCWLLCVVTFFPSLRLMRNILRPSKEGTEPCRPPQKTKQGQ